MDLLVTGAKWNEGLDKLLKGISLVTGQIFPVFMAFSSNAQEVGSGGG